MARPLDYLQKSVTKIFDQGNMDKSKDQKALEEEFLMAPNELVARDKLLVRFTIMRVLSELELGAVSESEWESADEDVETVYKAFLEQEGQARARGIGRIANRPSALKAASTALTVAIEVAKERLVKGECIDASMLLRGLTEAQLDDSLGSAGNWKSSDRKLIPPPEGNISRNRRRRNGRSGS